MHLNGAALDNSKLKSGMVFLAPAINPLLISMRSQFLSGDHSFGNLTCGWQSSFSRTESHTWAAMGLEPPASPGNLLPALSRALQVQLFTCTPTVGHIAALLFYSNGEREP